MIFLTITITVTTNKTLIRNKPITGEKPNSNSYLSHPNYEETKFIKGYVMSQVDQ